MLTIIICIAYTYSQNLYTECEDLYKLHVVFNEKNIPQKFKFIINENFIVNDAKTLYPIQKSIDFDGIVQFSSSDGLQTYHISYVDPGDEKK